MDNRTNTVEPSQYYPKWYNDQTNPVPVHVIWQETPKNQQIIEHIEKPSTYFWRSSIIPTSSNSSQCE